MARWSTIEGSIYKTQQIPEQHFMKNFFEKQAFQPKTEKEKQELHDFSFISSAMALLVHIARADGKIDKNEKKTIIDELQFQIHNNFAEYKLYSEEFGPDETEIVERLFDQLKDELAAEKYDLNDTIRIIDMIYKKIPQKRYFLLRLCYSVGYADKKLTKEEEEAIDEIAQKLEIDNKEKTRIKKEIQLNSQS